ncbi:MAG: putative bifunctional diguanylate cyclase/phosphodiesterase [Candidatus Methylumidiphilus sp.]
MSTADHCFPPRRLLALVLLGEIAAILALEHLFPPVAGWAWAKAALAGLALAAMLALLSSRLRRDGLALAYKKTHADAALASIGDGVVVTDAQGRVEYLNSEAENLTGWRLAEVAGKALDEAFPLTDESGAAQTGSTAACLRLGRAVDSKSRLALLRKDGSRLGIEDSASPILDGRGAATGAVWVFRDVTGKRKVEDELNLAASVFANAVEGIIITDRNGLILRVNKAFCAITGYAPEDVVGKNPRMLSSGRHDRAFYQAMWQRLESVGEWQGEVWNRRRNGEVYPEWLNIRAIYDERGEKTHYVGIFSDISERIRDQEYIFRLAYYDSLTSVANRALLMDHLEMAIAHAQRQRMAVAVLFIDMDRFKLINDSLGHSIGDLLLQHVAQALTGSVRDGDTVSRFGGDEFVICLPDISGDREDAVVDSLKVAEKIQRRLSQTFALQGHEVAVTPSIGVALYPWDGETPGILIKHADIAMYHAKSLGRDNVQMFSEAMLSAGSERLRIQSALRKAVESREFLVYYQAQIDLPSGKIVGAEALLRWNNPELGWTPPNKFIPVAEDTSLIVPIGDWVLGQVCRDWKAWREKVGAERELPRIALNFSPRQFIQPDFFGRIMRVLDEAGVSPECMEIEITEATLMHNTEMALHALNQLRGAGIRIAVDDFGVGYSSLSYLKKFPIDVLKIDQSFICDICTDVNDAQIVRAIIAMGHSLNLKVLAEGVETAAQLAFLRGEGCQAVQGFLLSPPVPADDFAKLLDYDWNSIIRVGKARAA